MPDGYRSDSSDNEERLLSLGPLNDVDASQKTARYATLDDFCFLTRKLRIDTDAGPGCGGHLWPSAVVLSRYLQHIVTTDPTRWQGKTAVELGAGTGVVACALGLMQVPGLEIYSTDLAELLPLAEHNVKLNGLGATVHVKELYWGKALPEDVPHQPDLLLLADCIYLEITFPWLVETICMLTNEKTEILLCYKKRRKADKRFFVMLKKHFEFNNVEDDPHRHTYEREGLHLYRVKRKPTKQSQRRSNNKQETA